MYDRKSVDTKMEPWGTPALTGYSCEDILSRTTCSCLLLRKDEIGSNSHSKLNQPKKWMLLFVF